DRPVIRSIPPCAARACCPRDASSRFQRALAAGASGVAIVRRSSWCRRPEGQRSCAVLLPRPIRGERSASCPPDCLPARPLCNWYRGALVRVRAGAQRSPPVRQLESAQENGLRAMTVSTWSQLLALVV